MNAIIRRDLVEIVRDSLRDDFDESRRMISFWGPRGSGKTTLLAGLYKRLSKQKELDVQKVFDVSRPRDYNKLLDLLANSPPDPKSSSIILIDNLDSLCSEDREDLGRLEWRLADLVENTKARIICTSSIEPDFWYEDQLRIRAHRTKRTSFSEREIEDLALPHGLSAKKAYQLSFGYPAALSWAIKNKALSEREISTIAIDHFFGNLDEPTRKMASVACITPLVGAGTYDDTHSAWIYVGNWTAWTGSGPLNNTSHYTSTVGNYAELTFTGARFTLTYAKHPSYGLIDVYVDGTKVDTINTYNATTLFHRLIPARRVQQAVTPSASYMPVVEPTSTSMRSRFMTLRPRKHRAGTPASMLIARTSLTR